MTRLRSGLLVCLLMGAAYLSVASLQWDTGGGDRVVVVDPGQPHVDETWLVRNVFHGQTAVPLNHTIRLTVGHQDFLGGTTPVAPIANLRRVLNGSAVFYATSVFFDFTTIVATEGFEPDTDYELDLSPLGSRLESIRVLPPRPIRFSTREGPQVTGLWRSGDTLIVAFSEPMDPQSLDVGFEGVNILWKEGGELRSLAGDLNLAGFSWRTDKHLFLMASVAFADALGSVWIHVSGLATGLSGELLDGDGDGWPGEPNDDFFRQVQTKSLPTCYSRADIPAPCVTLDEVPNLSGTAL